MLIIGTIVAVIVGIAVAVSGGNDTETTPVVADDTETTEASDPPAVSEPEPPSTTTTPPTTAPAIVNVGATEWYEWEGGLQAQVTSIEQYTPEYDDTPLPDVAVTVTIKNGTGALYDATQAMLNLYGGPNGVQAETGYEYYGFEGQRWRGVTRNARRKVAFGVQRPTRSLPT